MVMKNKESNNIEAVADNKARLVKAKKVTLGDVQVLFEPRSQARSFKEKLKNEQVVGEVVIKNAVDSSSVLGLGANCVGEKAKESHKKLVAKVINIKK